MNEMDKKIQSFINDLTKRDFLVFAGAGIPRPSVICDWRELLQKLNDLVDLKGIEIQKVDPLHFPEIAQMIYVALEDQWRKKDYYETIENALQPKNCKWHSVQFKIVQESQSIITTNLDTSFEDAINDRLKDKNINETCKYQTLSSLSAEKVAAPRHVTYLHGRRGEKDIILKTEDYVKYYSDLNGTSNSFLVEKLKEIFCRFEAIVFVGFSFEDRYIRKTFKRAFRELQQELQPSIDPNYVRHYALMPHAIPGSDEEREALLERMDQLGCDSEDYKRCLEYKKSRNIEKELKEIHIEVLRYEYGMHGEIEEWFEKINDGRRSSKDAAKIN